MTDLYEFTGADENNADIDNNDDKALERVFDRLNPAQREAVEQTEGALLIIAGAGSGKTSVLCSRIANLILTGRALPWQILAVTFTNKAANELRSRIAGMGIRNAGDVWAGTFHSICVKLLRRGIGAIGRKSSFVIYDTDDSLRVIKSAMKELDVSEKAFSPKAVQGSISRAKDRLIKPADFKDEIDGKRDFYLGNVKKVYGLYQKKLLAANALDFDDIIVLTVEMLESTPDLLDKWQKRFRYIMVDEYQDTNYAQYRLISLLAGEAGNLCVVGDEDQSIYRFRGATIENILSFEREFNAKVIKLEQNYRSTSHILDAANGVIKNNESRKGKTLRTSLGEGDKVSFNILPDEQEEALYVAREIEHAKGRGVAFGQNAVLYRVNAQSRTIELALSRLGIPYRIIGGVRFYERKEIKDMLAYMSVITNPFDMVRLRRVINEPKRGIGDATQAEIERTAIGLGLSPIEVMERASEFAALQKKSRLLESVAVMFGELINSADDRNPADLLDDITEQTGYLKMLQKEGEEGEVRLQNIKELKSSIITFCEENPDASLSDFLEQTALIADIDALDGDEDRVVLMTMHSAKGLEFDTVFIVGAEEGIFPSFRSLADPMDIEEERRLAYVAITRAKRSLHITAAKQRLLFGTTMRNTVTRFVREIPPEHIKLIHRDKPIVKRAVIKPKPSYLAENSARNVPAVPSDIVYGDGDRVRHKIFGEGTVTDITPMGNDILLEIAFDRVGTKKIMAKFAKIEKL